MKLKIKSSALKREEERKASREWHQWFVWFPLRFNSETVIFLEKIYRRRDYYGGWEYSFKDPREER